MEIDSDQPELPVAYNLVVAGQIHSLREYSINLAMDGAEEGTMVVADNQLSAQGCIDKPWQSFAGNLHCSIILQPEFSLQRYHEIIYVAVVSLGNSLAIHLSALTALTYSWPNDIRIARHKIASMWLDYGIGEAGPWLTITCSVNIRHSPEEMPMSAMSIHEAEGGTSLTANQLLETWARQFVIQLNDWADRGFAHILSLWKLRAEYKGLNISLTDDNQPMVGVITDVTDRGDLVVEAPDGGKLTITTLDRMQ